MDKQGSNQLKPLRKKHNLTQKEVAKALNIDHSTLSKYENNQREVPKNLLAKLSELYEVDVTTLLSKAIQNSNDLYTYYRKAQVFKVPLNKLKIGLLFLMFSMLYLFFFINHLSLMVVSIFSALILLIYSTFYYKTVFKQQMHYKKVLKGKTLEYQLKDRTIHIPKLNFELKVNTVLSLLSFFTLSMFVIGLSDGLFDDLDYSISGLFIFVNITLFFYLLLQALFKRVYYEKIDAKKVNQTFNTYFFNALYITGMSSFIWFMMFLAELIHLDMVNLFEGIMLVILSHFYLYLIISIIHSIKTFRSLFELTQI